MSEGSKELSYRGVTIHWNADRMVNLTDMWKAAGSPENKRPAHWLRLDGTQELVEVLGVNVRQKHIYRSSRGRGGESWAMPNLAIAYAKALSPKFHAWANQAIIERLEEDRNPELAYTRGRDRAVKGWKREGRSDRWIQTRLEGIGIRHKFTDTLQEHGISEGMEYAAVTNAVYESTLGGTCHEVKIQRGLKPSQNLRDHLSLVEVSSIGFTECIAEEQITTEDLQGVEECRLACQVSGNAARKAAVSARRELASLLSGRSRPQKKAVKQRSKKSGA